MVLACTLAAVMTGSAVAKLVRAAPVVENLDRARVPHGWYAGLALIDLAGAAALVAGVWVPALAVAGGIGFAAYFALAVAFHLRAGDRGVVPPVVLGLVSAAVAVLAATRL